MITSRGGPVEIDVSDLKLSHVDPVDALNPNYFKNAIIPNERHLSTIDYCDTPYQDIAVYLPHLNASSLTPYSMLKTHVNVFLKRITRSIILVPEDPINNVDFESVLHSPNNDTPAYECLETGRKEWCSFGKMHRDNDLPARQADFRSEWWIHGQIHRTLGPAVVFDRGYGTPEVNYWISGKEVSKIAFELLYMLSYKEEYLGL